MNYFEVMCLNASKAWLHAKEHQRKIDLTDAKLAESKQRQILNQALIAKANNAVLLQDLEIEKKKLELEVLQRETHPPQFTPIDPP